MKRYILIVILILSIVGILFLNPPTPPKTNTIIKYQKIAMIDTVTKEKVKYIKQMKIDTVRAYFSDTIITHDTDSTVCLNVDRARKCISDSVELEAEKEKSEIKDSVIEQQNESKSNNTLFYMFLTLISGIGIIFALY